MLRLDAKLVSVALTRQERPRLRTPTHDRRRVRKVASGCPRPHQDHQVEHHRFQSSIVKHRCPEYIPQSRFSSILKNRPQSHFGLSKSRCTGHGLLSGCCPFRESSWDSIHTAEALLLHYGAIDRPLQTPQIPHSSIVLLEKCPQPPINILILLLVLLVLQISTSGRPPVVPSSTKTMTDVRQVTTG